MKGSGIADRIEWYRRLMDLFEVTATREAVADRLPALLLAASKGKGALPVRIEGKAVLVPAQLFDLLVEVIERHGLDDEVQQAVNADYARQEGDLRSLASELGLDPEQITPSGGTGGRKRQLTN